MGIIVAILLYKTKDDKLSLEVGQDIDDTPTLLAEIHEIGQWEFLTISDEEMIDTIRKGFFSNDELVRIYYGTLRIGIDFSNADEKWINHDGTGVAIGVNDDGDSVYIDLPPVQLLDENFLDETRTKSFIESGTWTNADRKALADRARLAMRSRCLTKRNLDQAQQTANQQVALFFRRLLKK